MSRSPLRSRSARRTKTTLSRTRTLRTELLEPRDLMSADGSLWSLGAIPVSASTSLFADNADTYVKNGSSNTNYGNSTYMSVIKTTTATDECRAFLRFDTRAASGTISSAILNLTALQWSFNKADTYLRIRLLPDASDGWVEGTGGKNSKTSLAMTWRNQPSASGQAIYIPASQWPSNGSFAIDVTSLLNQDININGIATFEIDVWAAARSKTKVRLATRENAIASFRPSLTIASGPANQAPTIATAAQAASSSVTGISTTLSVLGADDAGEANLSYRWSATSIPSGASAPVFNVNGTNAAKNTTVTFTKAGSYALCATVTDANGLTVTSSVTVVVNQTLTGITVTPGTATLAPSATQLFAAAGADQFGYAMSAPGVTWSTTGGSITTGGLLTAPGTTGSIVVTAASGSLTGTASVTVSSSGFLGIRDAALAGLTQSLYADGSISRLDMIQILRSVGSDDSVVDSTEIVDLRTILTNASTLQIADYVKVLAGDVVNGNTANAHYQGQTLGNLAAGSSATQLTRLVDKWFLGADHPGASGYTYRSTSGSLFVGGPSHLDMFQGNLGDCYYISSLGSIADSSAAAIQNMFLDNGDNTWTVRFFYNGVADYVTVDRMLPTTSSGQLIFANWGDMYNNSANELWIPLAEKAYAQWNETGKEGRDGQNLYSSIEGGWMSDVYSQVLGKTAYWYYLSTSSDRTALVNAMTNHWAVTVGTVSGGTLSYGLYGNHAYDIVAYNATAGTFTLYNPWGSNQPTKSLTWTELQSVCDAFAVVNPAGTTPIATQRVSNTYASRLWAVDQNFQAQPHDSPDAADGSSSDARGRRGAGSPADRYAQAVDMLLEQAS